MILSVCTVSVFATQKTATTETIEGTGTLNLFTGSGAEETEDSDESAHSGAMEESWNEEGAEGEEAKEKKIDREKTINDINTFLIESYKIKIDKILSNLNMSIERITRNDPVAQAKLLEKIRSDVSVKIEVINSRNISENRKKILSSVFSYIQENLDANISRLVKRK